MSWYTYPGTDIPHRYVIDTHPYIDSTRVGIMGTNYGASLASLVVGQSKLAMCGVITSPVVQWRHHGKECNSSKSTHIILCKMFSKRSGILAFPMIQRLLLIMRLQV